MSALSPALDRIDRQLLELLQRDGRISIAELARSVHLSQTPCAERVRRLEREGFIERFCAQLNPKTLGLQLLAFVEVRLDRTSPDVFTRFKDGIRPMTLVQECHMVAGGFDYLIKVRANDMTEYRRFLEDLAALPGVQTTHTFVVMEEVKSTSELPIRG
jgi:Lrp/AsnC family transcriptional regulator, leucine-responsive regulatory protein